MESINKMNAQLFSLEQLPPKERETLLANNPQLKLAWESRSGPTIDSEVPQNMDVEEETDLNDGMFICEMQVRNRCGYPGDQIAFFRKSTIL